MPREEELSNHIKKLELELGEKDRRLIVQDTKISQKELSLRENQKVIRDLQEKVAKLTTEKQQLQLQIEDIRKIRPKPTPSMLMNSLKLAMEDLKSSLQPKAGMRAGYSVNKFDIDLKAAITMGDNNELRLVLPDPGEKIPGDVLSSIRFTFQSEPEAEIPDEELVEAPSILGLTLETAREELAAKGLTQGETEYRQSKYPTGTVIGQYPDGGDLVPPESPIDIVVSNNNVVGVPMVTGTPLEDAKTVIEKAGLSVGKIVSRENPAPAGTVIEQDPDPEMQLPEKSSVDLMIAAEPKIKVPDLKGLSLEDATRVLKKENLDLGEVRRKTSPAPPNSVLDQRPAPDEAVPAGTAVALMLSQQPEPVQITVPNLVARSLAQAKMILQRSTLSAGRITYRKHSSKDGVVADQSPKGGDKADKGADVDLVVWKKVAGREVIGAVLANPEIERTGYKAPTIKTRLDSAGIDSVEKLEELSALSDAEIARKLRLRDRTRAPQALREIIRKSLG
ncbi:PASTA domain-containing protein [Prosthecochloris vibrioformis]|uniref:PASTA domain-containing protein n=1 Tax=Prosthecochloris vibrioformis TaxID=1098 RepID=A0A5C4RZM5_PROVB|nr:PASTA domain-containing protein [Prosthecochloris vibrioformis]TNJ36445.1 PASTA domain-containing protein [Prosthecochloris vibrioformis]